MIYWNIKHLARRTTSDQILPDKAFNIAKNSNFDGYQRGFASVVQKFFDKNSTLLERSESLGMRDKSFPSGGIQNEKMTKQQLSEELCKPIWKIKKRRVTHVLSTIFRVLILTICN